ncbi:aminopeptidase [Fredinandcohnia humi]
MEKEKVEKLAKTIVTHSIKLRKGENVLIESFDTNEVFVNAIIKEVYLVGGNPIVKKRDTKELRQLIKGATKEQLKLWSEIDDYEMNKMDAYIGMRGQNNVFEYSDITSEQMSLFHQIYTNKVHVNTRVKQTKWLILRYPNESMAQQAKMSTEAFQKYYFDVCTVDYQKMSIAMEHLVTLMDKTDKVRITGKETDLTFSIKNIPSVKCAGTLNLPDGEVYTAPVKDSVNGTILFNTPSSYDGFVFEKVKLRFDNGKIVKAEANDSDRINHILDTDEGARYIGEFAIGVNPFILEPMGDILFDEKITGSIHLTPGQCYDDAYNGNHSSIHWDFVFIQRPEYGGGELWFDDRLIRKDGRFVLPELQCLNVESLK